MAVGPILPAPRLLYLSGAPRVSTRRNCAEPGARTHVVGTISGFAENGWAVRQLIVGDLFRTGTGRLDGGRPKSAPKLLLNDLGRIAVQEVFGRVAAAHLHGIDLCYERFGLFQALGWPARQAGVPWMLETQAVCWREAQLARCAVFLVDEARRRERLAYQRCSAIVTISEAVKEEIREFADVPPEKILVVPNGVDVRMFSPPDTPPPVDPSILRIGFVGVLLRWQNLDALIKAMAQLATEGRVTTLDVAGDGAELEPCRAMAASLGLQDRIRFLGRIPHDQVPQFLRSFDIGYTGQRPHCGGTMYGSPLKLYEYMAVGLPFIASDYADARATVGDLCPELLFDPLSDDGLGRALRHAFHHREWLGGLRLELRRRALERYSWGARIRTMLAGQPTLLD